MTKRISDTLRRIIKGCGLSRYEVAKRSGLPQSTLSRLMAGNDITTDALDRLAPVLGLRLIAKPRKSKGK